MDEDWLKPAVAEFVGTFALIFIGVGAIWAAPRGGEGLLLIALAHGFVIAVMVSATMHVSGGHLNPAVTAGALAAGKIKPAMAGVYLVAQLLGGVAAGLLLWKGVGFTQATLIDATPKLNPDLGITVGQGILVEAVLTFFLVFVVFGSAVDPRARNVSGIAIGLTIALDIMMGGPLTGAAMNPARVFGPAVAANFWGNHLVYWVGPLIGGILAGIIYGYVLLPKDEPTPPPQIESRV